MDIADQMVFFVRAVDEGNLSAAARSLGVSPSSVSKGLRRLEDRLGLQLVHRSTRRLTVTDEGQTMYKHCARIVAELAETEAIAASMAGKVVGTLHVVSTVAFAKAHLLRLFPEFLKRYPALELQVELTDRAISLADEGIDVAIRFTEQVDESNVVARRLAPNERVICAAPSYLATHPAPLSPEALNQHNCLRLATVPRWNDWDFEDATGARTIHVRGNFEANSADAVYHAVLAGLGVARLSTYLVADDLAAGNLVQLLPQYTHATSHILALYAERRNLSPKVRCFIDFLVEQFQQAPPVSSPGPLGQVVSSDVQSTRAGDASH